MKQRPTLFDVTAAVLLVPLLMASAAAQETAAKWTAEQVEFFEKKIRPVLVEHCYACHSLKAAEQKKLRGGLLLDSRQGVLKGGDSGKAIVVGKPVESLLMSALRYEDYEMPPSGQLPAAVLNDFARWIEMGAPDPRAGETLASEQVDIEAGREHWAYRPLQRPPIPPHQGASPVDAFIQRKLAESGLQQMPPAERAVLARRVYLDLVGLPPTPEQMALFLEESSPTAYLQLVDRLLASPQFGERWGRHWLDVVRYAESITLRGTLYRQAWRYRDYVIGSLNADRPYDHFVRQQLAGDLLAASSLEEQQHNHVATAFLAMGNNNLEDQDKVNLRMDVVDEQLETIGRGLLAQTLGCARCHDHKFDPIPTRDYYALAGILRNTRTLVHSNVSAWIEKPLPVTPAEEARFKAEDATIARLQAEIKKLSGEASKLGSVKVSQLPGMVIDDADAILTGSWTKSTSVSSFVGVGYQHDQGQPRGANKAIFRPAEPIEGEYEVRFAYTPGSNRCPSLPITVASASGEKTTVIDQRKKPPIDGHFISLGTYSFKTEGKAEVRVSNENTSAVLIIDAVQFVPVALANKKPAASPIEPEDNKKELAQLQQQLKQATSNRQPRPMVMRVEEEGEIGNTSVHLRGNVHTLGDEVPRGFLQVASLAPTDPLPESESGRRELADWVTSTQNPLAARVLANRIWHWLFGAGLVRTTDNFGKAGELPSHPELLDYLATRLRDEGWSIKQLVREVVLSQSYRASSDSHPGAVQVDPQNRLIWRANRRRLDAECLLDAILATSGQMQLTIGGPTLKAGTSNDYDYQHEGDRRAVYWPVLRNSLPQLFMVFDFANPSMVVGRRDVSSTSPQALFMMNNPWVLEKADQAADRLLRRRDLDDRQRVVYAIQLVLGRPAAEREVEVGTRFVGSASADPQLRRQKWAQFIQALFSSLDFRYTY